MVRQERESELALREVESCTQTASVRLMAHLASWNVTNAKHYTARENGANPVGMVQYHYTT